MAKEDRVLKAASAADPVWANNVSADDEFTKVVLRRGDELMEIQWRNDTGALEHPLLYSLAGVRDVRLRNVAEALRVIGGRPDYTARKARKPATERVAVPEEAVLATPLPFDPVDDDDITIRRAVSGKSLTWRGSMTGEYQSGMVPPRQKIKRPDGKMVWRVNPNVYITVTTEGRRVLTFPAVNEQFRSCHLDSLVQVI